MRHQIIKTLVATTILFGIASCTQQSELDAQAQQHAPAAETTQPVKGTQTEQRAPDAPYVPTPQEVANQMLELANVTKNDVVYDLGSGDGRIPITAAQK